MKAVIVLAALAALTACAPKEPMAPTPERGAMLFAENCAACHGADAKGAGDASLGNGVAAPNLTTLTQRFGGTFPRDHVLAVLDGGERSDDPDAVMPEFGDEELGQLSHPDYGLVDAPEPIDFFAVTAYLETLQTAE